MKVVDAGHSYELDEIDVDDSTVARVQRVRFANKEPGRERSGVTTQEILRMLIDRTHYCNNCLPWAGNAEIIKHFELALALHEARAILRKVEKGEVRPDRIMILDDGHFALPPTTTKEQPYVASSIKKLEEATINPGGKPEYK